MNKSKGKARPKTSNYGTVRNNKVVLPAQRANRKPGISKAKDRVPQSKRPSDGIRLANDYLQSLTNPFDNAGVKLGWGTLVPTSLSTAYIRGTATCNADGTLALAVYPNAKGMITVANGGAAVSFATSGVKVDSTDQAAITANFMSGRVISSGIKAYPNILGTGAPGQVATGMIAGSNFTLFEALTPNDLGSYNTSHIGAGNVGATATGRPIDTESFDFLVQTCNGTGFASTVDFPFAIPYVSFSGLATGTVVFYEAVINLECLPIYQHSSVGISTGSKTSSLSDYFPSVESMYSFIRPYLPAPQTIGTFAGNLLGSGVGNLLRAGNTNNLLLSAAGNQAISFNSRMLMP